MADLQEKVALVTGAARYRGIGRAIAMRLAADGAHVVVCGRNRAPDTFPEHEKDMGWRGIDSVAEEVRAMGRRALAITADITRKDEVVAMIDSIKAEFGRLDIIVNNAGDASNAGSSPIFETDEAVWYNTMDVNINGVFLVSKWGGRFMQSCGNGGSIVMIASLAGRVGLVEYGAYCASKFAVIGFTQQLALELAKTGIRVNCVSPGSHSTDMMDGTIARTSEKYDLPDGALKEQLDNFIPMGRQGKVSELASVVSFVCSDDASYVTGQTINVDGGARLD
ncbi:MAG: SDR family oxidoreductase [Halioglobus sp.]|nr:SDR family oxidoreductase [Halioglobus sp.]